MLTDMFQARVRRWVEECFGPDVADEKLLRNFRFLEEAVELVQANGMTKDEVIRIVDYVFDRPQGELRQEVGGVMLTLAALCAAYDGVDMATCAEAELLRCWDRIDQIRAKQKVKNEKMPLRGVAQSDRAPVS